MATTTSSPTSSPSTQPAINPDSISLLLPSHIGLLSLGLVVLIVWSIRRIAYRKVLYLIDAPGRPSTLSPTVVVLALLVPYAICATIVQTMREHGADTLMTGLLGTIAQSLLWIIGIPILAKYTFKSGARRGMGLCLRHWIYDAGRSMLAILAVLPVCFAVGMLFEYLMPKDMQKTHEMLKLIGSAPLIWKIVAIFTTITIVPIGEELVFRGLMQSMLRRYFQNPWPAIIITSLIFALAHFGTPQYIPAIFVLAIVLGYNYERTGRLFSPIVIHMLFNTVNIAMTFEWI